MPNLTVVLANELDLSLLDDNFYLTLLERIIALHQQGRSMFYNAKVYFDGSHFVAIPREMQFHKKKKLVKSKPIQKIKSFTHEKLKNKFTELYRNKENLDSGLQPLIPDDKQRKQFIVEELARKRKNAIARKVRLYRKVYLQEWHYFCTFTYDDKKLDETQFRKQLSNTLKHFSNRKGWKYIGVWERSPEHNRLHFHALIYAEQMVGELIQQRDYSTKDHRMQITYQNTYFSNRFGRNDFKTIDNYDLGKSVVYLTKYIEKSGERIVYSKGLGTFVQTDIDEQDVVCRCGNGERKALLFDDFKCFDNGHYVGSATKDIISQMPKVN